MFSEEMHMDRAQCLVVRENRILTVKHKQHGIEYFCLPGGGVEEGETPKIAAARELKEECLVEGANLKLISMIVHDNHVKYTYYADIGTQEPSLDADPEADENPILVGIEWRTLDSLCERDRAYMWSAGLIYFDTFSKELNSWGDDISYPNKRLTFPA
jgi:ADP-ribose pyrophosphatase YjhB (NUDIX family)